MQRVLCVHLCLHWILPTHRRRFCAIRYLFRGALSIRCVECPFNRDPCSFQYMPYVTPRRTARRSQYPSVRAVRPPCMHTARGASRPEGTPPREYRQILPCTRTGLHTSPRYASLSAACACDISMCGLVSTPHCKNLLSIVAGTGLVRFTRSLQRKTTRSLTTATV